MRANELPLFAGDSGQAPQLSSVYTALLTEARDTSEEKLRASRAELAMANREASRQSALEALDQVQISFSWVAPAAARPRF